MLPPHRLAGLALLLALGLVAATEAVPLAQIAPADAEAHEGRRVRIQGTVHEVLGHDPPRFILASDGAGITVRLPDGPAPGPGDPVAVQGRLGRIHGTLTLWAEAWDFPPSS